MQLSIAHRPKPTGRKNKARVAAERGTMKQSLHNAIARLAVPGCIVLTGLASIAPDIARLTSPALAQVAPTGEGAAIRRLNEGQYLRSIEQVFGPGIRVPGRFAPSLREQGLLAIGEAHVSVSPSGFEQYELRAREIAQQALAMPSVRPDCARQGSAFDRVCAANFLAAYGRKLYRRPLDSAELTGVLATSERASAARGDFVLGLEAGLSRLLVSPNFIFRVERPAASPDGQGQRQLDDYSLATRISFLLWDAAPDEELLAAAERGELRDQAKLAAQVDRMMASPRFEQGVRSFFFDMLGFDQFAGLVKDQAIFPKFNSELARDAQEQTLRTLVNMLIAERGDYRDIFTTRKTFMNRGLAALYRVPAPAAGVEGWAPYTFPADSPRAGLLSLSGFLMLDPTHEGKSSPTIRGKTVRELLLCQPVPAPPPNVNFSIVQDDSNPLLKTARQRLIAHQESPACAGCHALTDPIGLSLENYDGIGAYRSHEHDAEIDATGTFDGKPYVGLIGLSQRLRESPDVPGCLVQRVFEYGSGRAVGAGDNAWLEVEITRFESDGFRLPALMRRIATGTALRSLGPVLPEPASQQASLDASYRRTK